MPFRSFRPKWPGLVALAVLGLLAAALTRRRFRLTFLLFHVAVAAGEAWSERRTRRRVARVLASGAVEAPRALPERA